MGREDVLGILVLLGATETAAKVKAIIRQTIEWAVAKGHVETNVVDAVKGALPKRAAAANHHRALRPPRVLRPTLRWTSSSSHFGFFAAARVEGGLTA